MQIVTQFCENPYEQQKLTYFFRFFFFYVFKLAFASNATFCRNLTNFDKCVLTQPEHDTDKTVHDNYIYISEVTECLCGSMDFCHHGRGCLG